MATLNIKGLDTLDRKFDSLGQIPDKVKKDLVNQGSRTVLDQMKSDAPKGSDNSYRKLAIVDSRNGNGYLFMDIGINSKNWDECRGLYFQNYYGERSSGEHVMWMNKSFKKSKVKARKIIREGLKSAIK